MYGSNNYYPKNWGAMGFGWHNLAAMGYANPPETKSYQSGSSSGVSSMYPSPSQYPQASYPHQSQYPHQPQHLSYQQHYPTQPSGLYPNMPMPALPDGVAQLSYGFNPNVVPSPIASIYPSLSPADDSDISAPKPEESATAYTQETPCASITVPLEENMYWLGEKGSGTRYQSQVQDFNVLRNQCLANGSLFEDPDFPAANSSLMFSRRPDRYIEWLRPKEIVDDPQFFVEGYSRFDVQQGELGDCWLLAATANLTADSKLFFRVVPPDQDFDETYAGIFHFRFWQYGKWIDVVVDDRLPTYNGELMYMHSTEKNEFWSALLEKAYAKLHGSYEALKGGSTCEAMEDFTGGVGEMYDLKEAPKTLFNILLKAYERSSMMSASLEADPNVVEAEGPFGLIRGHAYSVTKVKMVDIATPNMTGQIPLLRLRNPWGNEAEWKGAWSDNSPEWRYIPEHAKEEIGLTFDIDGEFWMAYQDFLRYFDRIEICNLSPDSLSEEKLNSGKKKWEMSMFEGEWTPGVTAGGCRNYLETFWHNPQYVITLEDPDDDDDDNKKCTVIIALMQKNRRSRRNAGIDCLTIGFAIYHLSDRDLMTRPQKMNFFRYNTSIARSPVFINLREVSSRFELPPGHYLIVPSTFDPNEEGEFLIRVFSEHKNNMEENDEEIGINDTDPTVADDLTGGGRGRPVTPDYPRSDPQRQALEKLFMDIAGEDMEVDWVELKRILDHSMRDDLPQGPQNGYEQTQIGYVSAGRGDGGNGDDGGGGNLLALLCGPFCKGTPIGEAMGLNEPAMGGGNVQNTTLAPTSAVMNSQGGFSKDVCRSMIAMMDIDQSGKLGFEEFQTLLSDIAKWKAVFKVYDREGNGFLDAFQLRDALGSAGYRLNNRILNALAHRYGTRERMISFDDFIMCAVKIKTMIDIFKERDQEGSNTATFSMDEWVEKAIYS